MFSSSYKGVVYFGLWAEETADCWRTNDALGLLRDAVTRCIEEDMRKDDAWQALAYLSARSERKAPFLAFRKALSVVDPLGRYNKARKAYHTIGRMLTCTKR